MARPEVAPRPGRLREAIALELRRRARKAGLEPEDALERFFAQAIELLPGSVRNGARFGEAGGRWALTIGNYYLAATSRAWAGLVAVDTSAVPSRRRPFPFASAAGPIVFAAHDIEHVPGILEDPEYWRPYEVACEVLQGSAQGRSPHFLTSRVRAPLADVLEEMPHI